MTGAAYHFSFETTTNSSNRVKSFTRIMKPDLSDVTHLQ